MIAVRAQDLDESERAMGNGISLIALPQWYRDWGLKYGKRGYALHALLRALCHADCRCITFECACAVLRVSRFIQASKSANWDRTQDAADLAGKIHLVTGANAGIGFEVGKCAESESGPEQ
jgi:hypothetical protein